MIKTKRKGEHTRDCVNRSKLCGWTHVWGVCEDIEWLDRRGGRTGTTTKWLRYGCNFVGCRAKLYVKEDDIFDHIEPTDESSSGQGGGA